MLGLILRIGAMLIDGVDTCWTFYALYSTSSSYSNVIPAAVGVLFVFFFFNDTATTEIYTLSLHDALPISMALMDHPNIARIFDADATATGRRSEEHTSELQSLTNLVCRLLLEKKKKKSWRGLSGESEPNTQSS